MSLKRRTLLQCLNNPFPEEAMLPSVLHEEKKNALQMLILMRVQEMPSPGVLQESPQEVHFVSLGNKLQVWQ